VGAVAFRIEAFAEQRQQRAREGLVGTQPLELTRLRREPPRFVGADRRVALVFLASVCLWVWLSTAAGVLGREVAVWPLGPMRDLLDCLRSNPRRTRSLVDSLLHLSFVLGRLWERSRPMLRLQKRYSIFGSLEAPCGCC